MHTPFEEENPSFEQMWTKYVSIFTTECLVPIYHAIKDELKKRGVEV
jgi:hypothetical protein